MLPIARVGAPHGIQGWVSVHTFTESPENALNYQPWHIQIKDEWKPVVLEESKARGAKLWVRFENSRDRDAATLYRNCLVGVYRTQLPPLPKDEYYWTDLIGLQVTNQSGVVLGTVERMLETGANDVVVVKGEREHLLPWIRGQVILEVDLKKKTLQVDWDETF